MMLWISASEKAYRGQVSDILLEIIIEHRGIFDFLQEVLFEALAHFSEVLEGKAGHAKMTVAEF
jgi:hypothetical protein